MSVIKEIRSDLRNWRLGRVITVLDRGFTSDENMKELQRAGGHYIIGERMRSGKAEVAEAMKRPGRGEARSRYVLVHNPVETRRQKAKRDEKIEKLRAKLGQIRDLPRDRHTKAICELVSHRAYGRYLRDTPAGIPKDKMSGNSQGHWPEREPQSGYRGSFC